MTIRLRFEELDYDPEEHEFPDIEAAIKFAKAWFLDGYDGMYDNAHPSVKAQSEESLREYARMLEDDLRAGRRFYCNRFYETITFV